MNDSRSYSDYREVPWMRKAGTLNLFMALTVLLFFSSWLLNIGNQWYTLAAVVFPAIICVTGKVYTKEIDEDGKLICWDWNYRMGPVVMCVLVLLYLLFFAQHMKHGVVCFIGESIHAAEEVATPASSNNSVIRITEDELKQIQQKAKQGNSVAQYFLAECYFTGNGVEKNMKNAVYWYEQSAANKSEYSSFSLNSLGVCYRDGLGVAIDANKAYQFFRKAAEQGNVQGQCNLGRCYVSGYGVTRDFRKAYDCFLKAAGQGNAFAQYLLGNCYDHGTGVNRDVKEAARWYRKAAEQGLPAAQLLLGECYQTGEGVNQNVKEAVKWYNKAAERGDSSAQVHLGICYFNGYGVEKNIEKAVGWYRKAAVQEDL